MIPCMWLKKAREDLVVAEDEVNRITWASVFHSQQAAEKALKAVLSAVGVQPPKTHIIEHLLMLLRGKGVDVGPIMEASRLTDYAVEARYPDFEDEPSEKEALEALETARRVADWAKNQLSRLGVNC